ncbi:MAG: thiamine-phosphate kinase [Bacteroidales bacterium]
MNNPQQSQFTALNSLSKQALIKHLTGRFAHENMSTKSTVGDDATVVDNNESCLISSSTLIAGIDFDLMYVPLVHLGYKAVTNVVADISAMHGYAEQIIVNIAVSDRFSVETLEDLFMGIEQACNDYRLDFTNLNLKSTVSGMVISTTAIGTTAENKKAVGQNGAIQNDLICVTGDLGAAYMGLQLLEREKEVFKVNPNSQPQLEGSSYILERYLRPKARVDLVQILDSYNIIPTTMKSIDEGLAAALMHIATNSTCGTKIYEEKVPMADETINTAQEFNINPIVAALNGGDDFEILFTVSINDFEKIKNDTDITVIGHITAPSEGNVLTTSGGSEIEIKAQGWNM